MGEIIKKKPKMVDAICEGCGITYAITQSRYNEKKRWGRPFFHTLACYQKNGLFNNSVRQQ